MQYCSLFHCQRPTTALVYRSKAQHTAIAVYQSLHIIHYSPPSLDSYKSSRLRQHQVKSSAEFTSDSVTMTSSTTPPFLCGLTGSIGMGKSTVSAMFANHGVPVLSADEVVHQLYAPGGPAVEPVRAVFPSAVINGAVDRPELSKCVVGNQEAMNQLEGIVHPLVEAERVKFVQQHAAQGTPLIILDIPLLYETKAESDLDAVIVVSAPVEQQHQRVMARPGMTEDKLKAILARQLPDVKKCERADYVINTGCSIDETEQQVVQLIRQLQGMSGTAAVQLLGGSSMEAA